jgi:histidinol dehydrogenase
MRTIINPSKESFLSITRPYTNQFDVDMYNQVSGIMEDIARRGDVAIAHYSKIFDGYTGNFLVNCPDMGSLSKNISVELRNALDMATCNIEKFHKAQFPSTIEVETAVGVICRARFVPIERIGIYVPGGTAPLISTVLMLAIPAKIAGCKEVVLFTPPSGTGVINSAILYAARLCGITEIYTVGGIQAIGAMAIGTESIRKVDKIFGPGNAYVTMAKQWASARGVAIDMPAGPSEVAVIADQSADADFVATDLLSQAEHSTDALSVLLTTSQELVDKVQEKVIFYTEKLGRKLILEKSIKNMFFVVANSLDECIDFSNAYAPEHLIINCTNSELLLEKITNAGSVFVGQYSPESLGDYASGTNHTLPTGGAARAYNALGVTDFMKRMLVQNISSQGLQNLANTVNTLADAEGLDAHRLAVDIRISKILKNQ